MTEIRGEHFMPLIASSYVDQRTMLNLSFNAGWWKNSDAFECLIAMYPLQTSLEEFYFTMNYLSTENTEKLL